MQGFWPIWVTNSVLRYLFLAFFDLKFWIRQPFHTFDQMELSKGKNSYYAANRSKKGNFLVLVFILTCEKVNLVIIRNECWFIASIELSTKVCSVFSTIIDLKLPKEHRIRCWMCLSARVSIALPRSIKCSLYPTKVNMLLMLWGIPKTIQEQLPNRLTVTQH